MSSGAEAGVPPELALLVLGVGLYWIGTAVLSWVFRHDRPRAPHR